MLKTQPDRKTGNRNRCNTSPSNTNTIRKGSQSPGNTKWPFGRFVDLPLSGLHSEVVNFDISELLNQWPYEPGKVMVRKFQGEGGVEKIQLRLDLGLLQMNAVGRPDGKKPFGHESLLEHYETKYQRHLEQRENQEDRFTLDADDCSRLQQEAIQYHHRYICLFYLGEYDGVIRDTNRNLRAFDFARLHAESEELAWSLQQFRPQLLMMNTRAHAAKKLEANDYETAISVLEGGLNNIRSFYSEFSKPELLEQSGELQSLEIVLEEVRMQKPLTERERLQQELDEAVRQENYEKAARVRDRLRKL